jgi:hypothetical protein
MVTFNRQCLAQSRLVGLHKNARIAFPDALMRQLRRTQLRCIFVVRGKEA